MSNLTQFLPTCITHTIVENDIIYAPDGNSVFDAVATLQGQIDDFQGLYEIDINGDLEPVTDSVDDQYYELDGLDDIMPKAA